MTLALLPLVGCGVAPPPGSNARLPSDATQGAGDPTRAAILGSAYAFGNNTGGPAALARAAANMEFLAATLPYDPRYSFMGSEMMTLPAAQSELRQTLLIASDADPQLVIDGLYGVSRALRAENPRAAADVLPPRAFPQAEVTVQRLAAMPPLPATAAAASALEQGLRRQENERLRGGIRGRF
ncbi:hypothetical protein EOD42_01475 [Rhodovarius crocodyli]|uniref:Uncharacterized protein n=1 Tax=Rhodovarius crocodyli TaxID=1979269 RepID=A0A437MMC7_9PROT|nr:hypothetical protein [Rhodovarius crocodyli]RVT98808.1 hypothetical protein EOD42_01475 [Rhodovarius crocodyli]